MTLIDYKYRFSNRIALTTPLEEENTWVILRSMLDATNRSTSLLFKFEGNISQVRNDHLYVHLKDSTRRDVLVKRKHLDDTYRGGELHTGDDVTLLCVAHNEGAVLKILKYRVKRKRPLIAGTHSSAEQTNSNHLWNRNISPQLSHARSSFSCSVSFAFIDHSQPRTALADNARCPYCVALSALRHQARFKFYCNDTCPSDTSSAPTSCSPCRVGLGLIKRTTVSWSRCNVQPLLRAVVLVEIIPRPISGRRAIAMADCNHFRCAYLCFWRVLHDNRLDHSHYACGSGVVTDEYWTTVVLQHSTTHFHICTHARLLDNGKHLFTYSSKLTSTWTTCEPKHSNIKREKVGAHAFELPFAII